MTEHVDLYADSFTITVAPYGASLTFQLSSAHPDPSCPMPPARVATIRMSMEHVKTMVMMLKRQVARFEEEHGVRFPVPARVLSQLGIGLEDWQAFWGEKG